MLLIVLATAGVSVADTPEATTLEEFDAPDADQGVAVDDRFFYAVDNSVIAKHRRTDGRQVARWDGRDEGLLEHMNSCIVIEAMLECANSNYSTTPMASSVETFDPGSMEHVASHSHGLMDEGSLVWTDRTGDSRIAGFAHYSKKGGEAFKGSAYSSVVLFDERWRRIGGYAFPPRLIERMAPFAASGGAVGEDGLLYVLGHDLPEMYVLARPLRGPYLVHIATISIEAEGQAFSFDPADSRIVWTIDRRARKVRRIRLPDIEVPAEVRLFL